MRRRTTFLLPAAAPLSGCAEAPLGYLQTDGVQARTLAQLGWGLGLISLAVIIVIGVLLVAAIWRHRTPDPGHSLAVRRDAGGMRWIYVGLVISVPILLVMVIWTLATIGAVAAPPRSPRLTIAVTGERWFWAVRYDDPNLPAGSFTTANEIVIPVGEPVRLLLTSSDVIHSFWVPKLGGKMDMIPGKTNVHWIEADRPGVYRGQCAEYCGLQHAKMAFRVTAVPRPVYEHWRAMQLSDVMLHPLPAALANAGAQVFAGHCAACHAIRGTPAGGEVGPDLSHFGGRATIAAGTLANTPANLAFWIEHPQQVKPGARMPAIPLSRAELAHVTAFLEAL